MNALAHPSMFQTAYRQITAAERAFVDLIVRELTEAARRIGRPVIDALENPLPAELLARDTHGWLQRPLVRAAITEQIREFQHHKDVSIDTLIRQLYAISTFSLKEITRYDEHGDPYHDLTGLTDDQWAAIESVEIDKNEASLMRGRIKVKVKRESKLAAIKQLTDLLGGPEAVSPEYRKSSRGKGAPQLPNDATADQVADAYASMIGE